MRRTSILAAIVSATALAAGLYSNVSEAQGSLGCRKSVFITSLGIGDSRTLSCNDGSAEAKITRIASPTPGNRYKITANLKLAGAFSATSNIIRPNGNTHCSPSGTPIDQNPTPASIVDKTCQAVNVADAQQFRLTAGDGVGN